MYRGMVDGRLSVVVSGMEGCSVGWLGWETRGEVRNLRKVGDRGRLLPFSRDMGERWGRMGDRGQGWGRVGHKGESWIGWETGGELG